MSIGARNRKEMNKAVIFTMLGALLTGFASCSSDDDKSVNNGGSVGGGRAAWTFEVGNGDTRTE